MHHPGPPEPALNAIRHTDIYLIDLILKRHFHPGMKILDAGCGMGRNAEYFLHAGNEVFGVDISEDDVSYLRKHALSINPKLSAGNFRTEAIENLSFDPEMMDVVINSAVLHFARDENHFDDMCKAMWNTLKPGGIFFCRLASDIGIENDVKPLGNRRYILPDGSTRFLVNESIIMGKTNQWNAKFLEPFKTIQVHGMRCMSNWILLK